MAAFLLVTIVVAREPGIQAAIERLLNPQVNLRKTPEVIRFDPPTIVTTPAIGMYTSILNKQIALKTFFLNEITNILDILISQYTDTKINT